jgi:hypothetical protein
MFRKKVYKNRGDAAPRILHNGSGKDLATYTNRLVLMIHKNHRLCLKYIFTTHINDKDTYTGYYDNEICN